jgi:hypothetical protein
MTMTAYARAVAVSSAGLAGATGPVRKAVTG